MLLHHQLNAPFHFGPIEGYYLLGGNNPPIPEPRGRRFLRDYIPGVADVMEWVRIFPQQRSAS